MKKLIVAFCLILAITTVSISAQAQCCTTVPQLVSNLINTKVENVKVNIGDITVQDLVDVKNVLSNNDIKLLNYVLNNNKILSGNALKITALLKELNILSPDKVVLGILNDGCFVIGSSNNALLPSILGGSLLGGSGGLLGGLL